MTSDVFVLVRRASRDVSMELSADQTAASPSAEGERLRALHESGTIDDDEYAKLKAQVVGPAR